MQHSPAGRSSSRKKKPQTAEQEEIRTPRKISLRSAKKPTDSPVSPNKPIVKVRFERSKEPTVEKSSDGLIFNNWGDYCEVVDYAGEEKNLAIPSIFKNRPVSIIRSIFDRKENTTLRSVLVPASVTEIGYECFNSCAALSEVTFEEGSLLKTISDYAFMKSGLTTFTVPKTVEEIGVYGFYKCTSLAEIAFEEGSCLKKIGDRAFFGCNFQTITIPKSVQEIGEGCFSSCESLPEVTFERGSRIKRFVRTFEWSCIKTFTVPRSVEEIGMCSFVSCRSLDEIKFEEGNLLKVIGGQGFRFSVLKTITIPKSVEEIGNLCFDECKFLSEVRFEEGSMVKKFGTGAFSRCPLKTITIPKSVVEIGDSCFEFCKLLGEIKFERGSKLTKIGSSAFAECKINRFTVPRTVEDFGGCFYNCSALSEVQFEEGCCLKKIGSFTFVGCNLRSFTVPKSVEEIDNNCFDRKDKTPAIKFEDGTCIKKVSNMKVLWTDPRHILVPKDVCEVPDYCFSGFSFVESICFDKETFVKKFGKGTFSSTGIKTLSVPSDVKEIDEFCFAGCPHLSEIKFEDGFSLESIKYLAFKETKLASITVPRGNKEHIQQLLEQCSYFDKVDIIETGVPEKPIKHPSDFAVHISEYEKVKDLGSGGFGNVFLYKKDAEVVAVKFIPGDKTDRASFKREVQKFRGLAHRFIIPLLGYALPSHRNEKSFLLMMENVSGGSLASVMRRRPSWFDDTSKILIIYGIALGMAYIHSKGIIHKNLKPENILFDKEHLPRICDFATSHLFLGENTHATLPSFKARYGAPELCSESEYNEKIDVYSFGVILYELVTGKFAFRKLSPPQLMNHVAVQKQREAIPGSVTPFSRGLIERCWAHEPSDRPSFAEICSLLENKAHLLFQDSNLRPIVNFINSLSK